MENLKKCLCGKKPVVKIESNGRVTIKCECGFYMPMCPSMQDAVRSWNSFVEKNNTPDEIKRIYGYEENSPKKKRKKTSSKKKTEDIEEDDIEEND